ncbi:MAG TPA: nitroreductase family deazaflavin-dependent oxidoreductase [Conexibacter sp.]|nr:nitroreductase family deazaflavin-dependent oxidoreductase [Conexibacter sp.]
MPNALVDRSWPLLTRLMGAHVALYRRSGGRLGHRPPGLPQMLLLDHVGARSGIRRTSPLVYTRDGDDYVLVASKGGYPRHPAWLHNLKANPDTTIQVGRRVMPVHAHVAREDERERLWPLCVATYRGFAGYQARAGRTIPLVVLSPRA